MPIDVTLALGLIAVALVVFLLARMEVLPRKSLPYVAAGLAGAFGIGVFNAWRRRAAKDDLARAEQAVKAARARLPGLKAQSEAAARTAEALDAQHALQREAYVKAVGQAIAEGKQQKAEIGQKHGDDLLEAVDRLFAK